MGFRVEEIRRKNYPSFYKDSVLDIEVLVTTNPLNIQVSTPNNTELLTPGQVQAQYEYFKQLNRIVQSLSLGKSPRIKNDVQDVAETQEQGRVVSII